MEVPFGPDELRSLAERARQAVVAYDRDVERREEQFGVQPGDKAMEDLANSARQLLGSLACMVGLSLERSMLPNLLRWPEWDPFWDDGSLASRDFFLGLSGCLHDAPEDILVRASQHYLTPVRVALARALRWDGPTEHRGLLEQLATDPQWSVARVARERMGEHAPRWYTGILPAAPSALLEAEELTQHEPALVEIEAALQLQVEQHAARDAVLERLVPNLPDAIAIPLVGWRLGQIDAPGSQKLVDDLARRDGAAIAMVASIVTVLKYTQHEYTVKTLLNDRVKALPDEQRQQACLALLKEAMNSSAEATSRELEQNTIPGLVEQYWSSTADPTPLWQAWQEERQRDTSSFRHQHQYETALARSERLDLIEAELIDALRRDELAKVVSSLLTSLDELIDRWPQERRTALVEEALAGQQPAFQRWALLRRMNEMAHTSDPAQCRRQMALWFEQPPLSKLLHEDAELIKYALPEVRRELTSGKHDLELASRTIRAIGGVYGGTMSNASTEHLREPLRARLGNWLGEDEAPTESEWSAYRRVQYDDHRRGEMVLLDEQPLGPWHPDDLELILSLGNRLQEDDPQSFLLFHIYSKIEAKPDARLAKLAGKVAELARGLDDLGVFQEKMLQLAQRLGASLPPPGEQPASDTRARPNSALHQQDEPDALDWMDQEEDEVEP